MRSSSANLFNAILTLPVLQKRGQPSFTAADFVEWADAKQQV
jgi:hypothetical protein